MYYTILERVLISFLFGMKIIYVYIEYMYLIIYLLGEDFMNFKAFLVTFFKHVLKVLIFCFFFGTAIINHFFKHIYILFVMFKYIIHHYCAVKNLAD